MLKGLRFRTIFPFYLEMVGEHQFERLGGIAPIFDEIFAQVRELFPFFGTAVLRVETDNAFVKYAIPLEGAPFTFLTKIQVWFQFVAEHHQVVGAFSLEDEMAGTAWLENVYLINLMNKFIQAELYPITWRPDYQDDAFVDRLHTMWERFVTQKFLRFRGHTPAEALFYTDTCFDLILSFLMLMWLLLDTTRKVLEGREVRLVMTKEPHRFQVLQAMVRQPSPHITIGQFLSCAEIIYAAGTSFLDYQIPRSLQKYVTLFLFPEMYSFACSQPKLIEYQKIANLFAEPDAYFPRRRIARAQYEHHNDFLAYVNDNQLLIIRNEVNRYWLRQAIFAKILLQMHIDLKASIEKRVAAEDGSMRTTRRWLFYRKILLEMNRLKFSFENRRVSPADLILKKMLADSHYENSLKILDRQVKDKYWLVLAAAQREYVALAFFIAAINFFNIFIMGVFTDLGAQSPNVAWKAVYIAVAFATLLTVIGLLVILGIIIQFFRARRISRALLRGV